MKNIDKKEIDSALHKAIEIIKSVDDRDIGKLLGDGILQALLDAIAIPKQTGAQSIYEYLFQNRNRLQLLALIRMVIHHNYAIKGKVGEADVFVSPSHVQWFNDGVMFLQGGEQFEGLMGLYQEGKVKFAIASREIRGGDGIGPEDLEYVDVDEMDERSKQPSIPKSFDDLDSTILQFEALLDGKVNDESKYQEFFTNHPWILGAKYNRIESHTSFNDENIPDFTAVRVRDSARDIIEIKPPFLPLFSQDNRPRAEFNATWNQAERYLDFARIESDYLHRQKQLRFENPKCYILAGYNMTDHQIEEVRRKERMNPSIAIYTYNDLVVMAKSTVKFVKNLKDKMNVEQNVGEGPGLLRGLSEVPG